MGTYQPGVFEAFACQSASNLGCVVFPLTSAKDRFVSLEVEDATGTPIHVLVKNATNKDIARFCGATDKPIALAGTWEVRVYLFSGPCPDPTQGGGVVSEGLVRATFVAR